MQAHATGHPPHDHHRDSCRPFGKYHAQQLKETNPNSVSSWEIRVTYDLHDEDFLLEVALGTKNPVVGVIAIQKMKQCGFATGKNLTNIAEHAKHPVIALMARCVLEK